MPKGQTNSKHKPFIVNELIETKDMLKEPFYINYRIVYEKFETREVQVEYNPILSVTNLDKHIEEYIKLVEETDEHSSTKCVKVYQINDETQSINKILNQISMDCRDLLFKRIKL